MLLSIHLLLQLKVNAASPKLTTARVSGAETKPIKSEGFKQIIDFLNGSSISYALTASPIIHTSCIKQSKFLKLDLHVIYDNPSLTKKVFANIKRVGAGFSGVVTLLFDNMLVPASKEVGLFQDDIEKLEGKVNRLEEENKVLKELHSVHSIVDTAAPIVEKEKSFKEGRIIADIDKDVEINLEEAQAKPYRMDLEHLEKVLSMQDVDDEEPAEVEEVLEVVTSAKLITEVVITAGAILQLKQQ
nr:hypothetical protein [Tanacetum cinerariifolium]